MFDELEVEIQRNFDFFQRNVANFLPLREGQYALLHNCSVAGFFPTAVLAEAAGEQQFRDAPFSIQEVTRESVDLGFFSNAFAER